MTSSLALFQAQHPDYKPSNEAAAALIAYVMRVKLDPSKPQSWHEAWTHLKPLLAVPTVEAVAPVIEQPKVVAAAVAPAVVRQTVAVPTGLSSADQFNSEDAQPFVVAAKAGGQKFIVEGRVQILNADDLDRMPSEKLKRILNNRANAQSADLAYTAQAQEQAARRAQRR